MRIYCDYFSSTWKLNGCLGRNLTESATSPNRWPKPLTYQLLSRLTWTIQTFSSVPYSKEAAVGPENQTWSPPPPRSPALVKYFRGRICWWRLRKHSKTGTPQTSTGWTSPVPWSRRPWSAFWRALTPPHRTTISSWMGLPSPQPPPLP